MIAEMTLVTQTLREVQCNGPSHPGGEGNRCSFWNDVFNFLHFGTPNKDTI